MQKDRVNRMNSVLLHELYFDGLTPNPGELQEDIRTGLARRFGSALDLSYRYGNSNPGFRTESSAND